MSATSRVIDVLNSREAANINFTALGLTISGTIFPQIAQDMGGISPTRFVTVSQAFSGGAAALYHTDTNTMEVGTDPSSSRVWKGLVIHEAVHAWIDKSSLQPTAIDNEAVSYIAQAIYYRRVGLSRTRTPNPIYLAARDVGNVVLQGGTPSATLLQNLKTLISNSSTYSHLTATSVYTANG